MSSVCAVSHQQSSTTEPRLYQRRQPQRTPTYQVVQHHLESWLARQREACPDDDPVPQYVERDLR
ncbi:MAG: hypothetical protein JMN25_17100, partial [gamma proteobacterium endosymbiont of Lamellibrachia anaximandri]|nr:hypothetical protein [gamma proteobacterium endosymbiont of Lamellibrachia anaximandri]